MTIPELRKLEDQLLKRCRPHNHDFNGRLKPQSCLRCELIDTMFEIKRFNRIRIALEAKELKMPKERRIV